MRFSTIALALMFLISFVEGAKAGPQLPIGTQRNLRSGDKVPEIPDGTLWEVKGHIQNMTISIMPGLPPSGPILEVEVVPATREQVGEKFRSTEVGGFLPGSNTMFDYKLESTQQGKLEIENYQHFVALLKDNYEVGKTKREVRDTKDLPAVPEGYTWEEVSRVDMVGSLIPDLQGGFHSSPDRVTYVLKKKNDALPDQFSLPRIVSGVGKTKEDFLRTISCGRALGNL